MSEDGCKLFVYGFGPKVTQMKKVTSTLALVLLHSIVLVAPHPGRLTAPASTVKSPLSPWAVTAGRVYTFPSNNVFNPKMGINNKEMESNIDEETGRVKSKHLFDNLLLDGVYDEEVEATNMKNQEKLAPLFANVGEVFAAQDDGTAIAKFLRDFLKTYNEDLVSHPVFLEGVKKCDQDVIKVPHTDENEPDVTVYVHRPKALAGKKAAAIMYAHGGGAIASHAGDYTNLLSTFAVEYGPVVFFNVDYRLAPEGKAPAGITDMYSALRYVVDNAESLMIDASRIAIAGDSGGGYITMGTEVFLARRNQSDIVRVAFPSVAMIDDYSFGDTAAMTKEERDVVQIHKLMWNALATDLEEQRTSQDPLLFPAKASDELLAKFPPTVVIEVEFDQYITENMRMANRLRASGRLLDLVVISGANHNQNVDPRNSKKFKETLVIMKTLVKEYLLN